MKAILFASIIMACSLFMVVFIVYFVAWTENLCPKGSTIVNSLGFPVKCEGETK